MLFVCRTNFDARARSVLTLASRAISALRLSGLSHCCSIHAHRQRDKVVLFVWTRFIGTTKPVQGGRPQAQQT